MSVHIKGCADIARREIKEHGATVVVRTGATGKAVAEDEILGELEEMGYTVKDFEVYPCCEQGPKIAPPVREKVRCPHCGMERKPTKTGAVPWCSYCKDLLGSIVYFNQCGREDLVLTDIRRLGERRNKYTERA